MCCFVVGIIQSSSLLIWPLVSYTLALTRKQQHGNTFTEPPVEGDYCSLSVLFGIDFYRAFTI